MKNEIEQIDNFVYRIKGKRVKIFADNVILNSMKNDKTLEQAKDVADVEGLFKDALVMPDGHQGYGFPIGGVAAFEDRILPGGIGFDINCGVRLLRTNVSYEEIKDKIINITRDLFKKVPSGLGVKNRIRLTNQQMNNILENGVNALDSKFSDFIEEHGSYSIADASLVSEKAKERGRSELGTLGSGNHFVEIQKVDEIFDDKTANAFGLRKDQVTIMIHTGSRGLGHQVASDWIRKIEKEHPERIKENRELIWDNENYVKAMASAANFAWANRELIMQEVQEVLKNYNIESELVYDVAHNIAKFEKYDGRKVIVHRKGATRAFGKGNPEIPRQYRNYGQPVLIPGSMGTASYVLKGYKAEKISLGSSPHGAGRVMSRHKAIQSIKYDKLLNEMNKKKIVLMSRTEKGAVEEAPEAYKDIDRVVNVTDKLDIAKKVSKMIPLGVIKG